MSGNSDAVSIRRFTWLLDQRGYRYVTESDLESVITIRNSKRPDFWVDTGQGVRFLAEVKSFEKPTAVQLNDEPRFAMFVDDGQRRINGQPIEKAAQQLAPYRNDGMPLIVVLDNHRQVGVSLGTVELIQIFGSLQYEFTVGSVLGSKHRRRVGTKATGSRARRRQTFVHQRSHRERCRNAVRYVRGEG